jgi:hypothetical protein
MRLNCIKSHTIHFVNRAGAGVSSDYINIVNHNYTIHEFESGPVIIISI